MTLLARVRPAGVAALQDRLLVQCGADDLDGALPLLRPGGGLVVTGARSGPAAARAADAFDGPVLADRARYAGARREAASAPLSPRWIDEQRRAGLPLALTDSGYVAAGDRSGLVCLLEAAVRLGAGVAAVVPVHRRWLSHNVDVLVDEANAHGVPVAVVVEHRDDPFGNQAVLRGLVTLLADATVPVLLLRSDVSALGAVAHGAVAGAFGVRSGLRHLFEQPKPGSGFRVVTPVPAALWPPGMYLVKTDRLAAAHARTPDDPQWVCACATCRGRTADWLYLQASSDEVLAHNVEVLLDARDSLVRAPAGRLRRLSWRAVCASAEFEFSSVAATTVRWSVPPAVSGWQKV